jgi:hypothetical protein
MLAEDQGPKREGGTFKGHFFSNLDGVRFGPHTALMHETGAQAAISCLTVEVSIL